MKKMTNQFEEESILAISPDKYMISGVKNDGEVIWQTEASYVDTILIPIKYRGYKVESLIRDGWVHMRMVGRHKQNSEELRVSTHNIALDKSNQTIYMNSILFPLAEKLAEEDKLFDAFTGKEK